MDVSGTMCVLECMCGGTTFAMLEKAKNSLTSDTSGIDITRRSVGPRLICGRSTNERRSVIMEVNEKQ